MFKGVLHTQGRIPTPDVRLPLLNASQDAVERALAAVRAPPARAERHAAAGLRNGARLVGTIRNASVSYLPPDRKGPMTSALTQRVNARGYERRWWILAVLCFSLLVIVLDNTILNVAIPTIVRDLDATNSQLQWMVDSYTLVFAGLLLTAGASATGSGAGGALQFGLVVFGIGSLAVGVRRQRRISSSRTRAFMGIGGAFIMPATLSIITNVFPPNERGKAIGVWAGTAGLAGVLGPTTGGFLLEHFYWGSIFLVNIPIVIARGARGHLPHPDVEGSRRAVASTRSARCCRSSGSWRCSTPSSRRLSTGWSEPDHRRVVRRRRRVPRRVHRVGVAHRPPDARREVLQEPALHRGELRHHADLLRDVRRRPS